MFPASVLIRDLTENSTYMFRKLHIFALMALALVSCAKEEAVGDVAVQFNAAVSPEMTVLVKGGAEQPEPVIANHAVLQAWKGDVKAAEVVQSIVPGTTQISFSGVKLAGGVEYLIYIWVDCKGYYNTTDLRSVSVSSGKSYNGQDASFDAFYSFSTLTCGQDDDVHEVDLKRPFAKVNFSAAVASQLKVMFTAPTTMDLMTGEVSGSRNVEYTVGPEASSVTAFDYIFATEAVSQMSYTFKLGEEEAKTTLVPLSRNRKTNIIYTVTN